MLALVIADDLFFQAKIQGAATALGVEVRFVKDWAGAQEAWAQAGVGLVDLSLTSADPLAIIRTLRAQRPETPIIGYGSHVETELLNQARVAGCTTVLPRSAFVQQLPRLLVRKS